ncbi:MAG: hypothetical protein WBQ78_09520 [Gammaproteobacteria bacterium]
MNCTNTMRARVPAIAMLISLLLLKSGAAGANSVGQIDTFEDGTLQGWQMGVSTVTTSHMTNIAAGGPAGAGDNFLQVVADGANVQGGRLTFFNRLLWSGDYTAAGVTAIAMDLKNISSSEVLNLRLAINGGTIGGVFATAASLSLDSGSGWARVVFSMRPGDLVPVSGGIGGNTDGIDVQAALANVLELRLLNSATPDWNGLPVTATLGIDNIQVVPLPPAFVLFGSGLLALWTQRRRQVRRTDFRLDQRGCITR